MLRMIRSPWWMLVASIITMLFVATGCGSDTASQGKQVHNTGENGPENPIVGKDDDQTPLKLGGISSWQDVKSFTAKHPWYNQPRQAAGVSKNTVNRSALMPVRLTKAVLVSNSTVSNAKARKLLVADGYKNATRWPVVRVNGDEFMNTSLDEVSGSWDPFQDLRSQVRATLLPVRANGSLDVTRGVLLHCGNWWWTLTSAKPPVVTPKPTPTPTETPLEPKVGKKIPPRPTPPPPPPPPEREKDVGKQPDRPKPPGGHDSEDGKIGDSGSGATDTVDPPPDAPSRGDAAPSPDEDPVGGGTDIDDF